VETAPPFGTNFSTVEWPLLLECCSPRPNLERIRSLAARQIDWRALLSLAEEHGVIAQLDAALRSTSPESIPQEVDRSLRDRHRAQLVFTLGMTAELFQLLEKFRSSGVQSMVVKGPVLSARAYGDPGLRQYVDLDFLIRARHLLPGTRVLIEAGYEGDIPVEAIEAGKIPGEYLFTKKGTRILVELHTEHTFRYFPRPLPMEAYFSRRAEVALDGNHVPALSAEDEFVLICIHGAKHFWERLMWVADVAAMASGGTRLNWQIVQESARAVGAERMVHVALRLVQRLLHTELPSEMRDSVEGDNAVPAICARIEKWLPYAGFAPPSLPQRARFRMAMRGGWIAGPAYLLRLSLSPTEEDWVEGAEAKRSWLWDAITRPFRLMKKYGQDGKA
jgi:putative nucleotidyltransferase-like protein